VECAEPKSASGDIAGEEVLASRSMVAKFFGASGSAAPPLSGASCHSTVLQARLS